MIDLKNLIDEVRELRDRGLSYSEIARTLESKGVKVSRVTVMRWCKGLHDPFNRMNSAKLEPSPELAYIVGVMFGDGSTSFRKSGRSYKYRIRLKVVDKEFAEEFKRCLEEVGLKPSLRFERNRARCDRWCVEANSKILYEFLRQPKDKLFEVAEKYPAEFLRGFFDSEGSVCWNEKCKTLVIDASNCDEEILTFARNLLQSLDIHSKIYKTKRKGQKVKIRDRVYSYSSDMYSLRIHRRRDVARFAKTVGFTIKRKMQTLTYALTILNP